MNPVYKSQKQRNQSMGREFGKIRVIAVYRMILENDVITARQIIKNLQDRYGIVCDRKTIFSDIAAIDRFFRSMCSKGNTAVFENIFLRSERNGQKRKGNCRGAYLPGVSELYQSAKKGEEK